MKHCPTQPADRWGHPPRRPGGQIASFSSKFLWYDRRMKTSRYCKITAAAALVALATVAGEAHAAQCGNSAGGFEGWKREFAPEAKAKGIGASGLAALAGTNYRSEERRVGKECRSRW